MSCCGRFRAWIVAAFLSLAVIVAVQSEQRARAEVIPEATVVVVNSESWVSRWLANEYQQLRGIPDDNIVHLTGLPDFERLRVDDFRQLILEPLLRIIAERGLKRQIHALVYSADIPTTIDVRADVGERKLPQIFTLDAAINGLTYTYPLVLQKDVRYLNLDINAYAQRVTTVHDDGTVSVSQPQSFRADDGWSSAGEPVADAAAPRFLLSTVLSVTAGRGLAVEESLQQLRRSVAADYSRPKGTVFFPKNGDVRSRTREWGFESAARQLQRLGVPAEVTSGVLPPNETDVAGAVIGIADFNWQATGARIQPGAIVEHLTSFGGVMTAGAGQTPLTEFLRQGAAGASGTVTEPYAIQAKFPTPFIQVNYAQGLSLVESFYQSVSGPYQLLIVGDALCRPWAERIEVTVTGWPADGIARGELPLTPQARSSAGTAAAEYRLYVDGRWHSTAKQEAGDVTLRCDTTQLAAGVHAIRVVAIGPRPIPFIGYFDRLLIVDREADDFLVGAPEDGELNRDAPFEFELKCAGAKEISLRHQGRELAKVVGESGRVMVDPRSLGPGPISIQPLATIGDRQVYGRRRRWVLPASAARAPLSAEQIKATADRPAGLRLRVGDGAWMTSTESRGDWLQKLNAKPGESVTLEWDVQAAVEALYQLQWTGRVKMVELLVNDQPVTWPVHGSWRYVPVRLAAGNHRLTLRCQLEENPTLELRWGTRGTTWLKSVR
ncbi:MAG: hypothetical protein ACKOBW_02645 [Planctomycetota bacterium]